MSQSLLLDVLAWDLVLDLNGNLAFASEPYALAQDAACAIKTFEGEVWFDTSLGIPYFTRVLGQAPPLALIRSYLIDAAVSANPDIASAVVFFNSIKGRNLSGQVQITATDGTVTASEF